MLVLVESTGLSSCNLISCIPPSAASILMEVMLSASKPKTCSNYGTGLLHFNQFRDWLGMINVWLQKVFYLPSSLPSWVNIPLIVLKVGLLA